jgi:hypothetical protein
LSFTHHTHSGDIGIGDDIRLPVPRLDRCLLGSEHLPRAVGRLLTYARFRVIADPMRKERLQLSGLSRSEPYLI